jgi:hypothetical protein
MADGALFMAGAGCLLAMLAMTTPLAGAEPAIATVGQPAVITVAPAPEALAPDRAPRAVVEVSAFRPPSSGAVQAVVRAQPGDGGPEQEIGRFAIFPNAEFSATDPSQVRRFGLALPKSLAGAGPLKLKVDLVPLSGDGQGARMEVRGAEIR